jgi:transcriptional regulator with XRE-family HTH domain
MSKKSYKESLTRWEDLREQILTPEERAASDLRVSMMSSIVRARTEKGITQRKLEEMSGVKQPVIARMESGAASTQLETVLKVLAPLGKTLCVVDIPAETKAKKSRKDMPKVKKSGKRELVALKG